MSRNIISFLRPFLAQKNIASFEELDITLKNIPSYTILPLDFFEKALSELPQHKILSQGSWVEIGVWKGGGALFFKALMTDLDIKQPFYLYDTFGEIPVADFKHPKDISFATYYGIGKNNSVQKDYQKEVKLLLSEHKLIENVHFTACDINSLPMTSVPENIAFLFLDVDFYEPTFSALNLFYDKVKAGGVIIIDDYYMKLFNCKEAVDDFFQHRNINLVEISEKFSSFSIKIIKP